MCHGYFEFPHHNYIIQELLDKSSSCFERLMFNEDGMGCHDANGSHKFINENIAILVLSLSSVASMGFVQLR